MAILKYAMDVGTSDSGKYQESVFESEYGQGQATIRGIKIRESLEDLLLEECASCPF